MDADKRMNASFGQSAFELAVLVESDGRVVSSPRKITCVSRCTASFNRGTRVVLRAQPGKGATFAGWGGACNGSRTCIVLMNADRLVKSAVSPLTRLRTVQLAIL